MPLYSPSAIAISPNGNMYVCDSREKTVYHVTPEGNVNLFATPGTFSDPTSIAANNDNIYVLDRLMSVNCTLLYRINPLTRITTLLSRFHFTCGIALGQNGHLYVARGWQNIAHLSPEGDIIEHIQLRYGEADHYTPASVTLDNHDNLYCIDAAREVVLCRSPDGRTHILAGAAGESGGEDGNGREARFNNPNHIAYDSLNNVLYVTEPHAHRIRRIVIQPDGMVRVTTIGGRSANYVNAIGPNARFNDPRGIAIIGGIAYCADRGNNAIRRIQISPDNAAAHVTTFIDARTVPTRAAPPRAILRGLPRTLADLLLLPPVPLTCSVCLEDDIHENLITTTCGHKFHVHCVLPWVNAGRTLSNNCPTCRGVIVREVR